MFRLLVRIAKLSSFRSSTSFSCTGRLYRHLWTPVFASSSSSLPQYCCSKSISWSVTPLPSRLLACRSLQEGLATDVSSGNQPQKEGSLVSDCVLEAEKASPSVRNRPLTPLVHGNKRSSYVWLYGATAATVLSFAAFIYTKGDGIPSALRDYDLDSAISEFQDLSKESRARVATSYDRVCTSFSNFWDKASEAATAMAVLARCVNAVLFTKGEDYANQLALRWKLRVVSLLADLTASSRSRRTALIQAGNGSVVDWLLEAVSQGDKECRLVQAEAARALSQFLSDDVTCELVLGRPHALSHLLLFAASIQPETSAENTKGGGKFGIFLGNDEKIRGRSMLVGALMDIITSSCESEKKGVFLPKLSGLANVTDISAALKVLREGSLCLVEANEESNGVSGGDGHDVGAVQENGQSDSNDAIILGTQKQLADFSGSDLGLSNDLRTPASVKNSSPKLLPDLKATSVAGSMEMNQETFDNGLWDDLHGNHVAVPLAAWAISTWAQTSSANCAKIARLDEDGGSILACIMTPERTVKWHGAIAARIVLEEGFGEQAAAPWSGALLEAAKHASIVEDTQLCLTALNSFYSCIQASREAQELAAMNSLESLRHIATQAATSDTVQKLTAQVLGSLCFHVPGLSSEEGKKWSSILLGWLFNFKLDDSTRFIASKVLALVLDELGQSGVLLSQVWLAMIIQGTINGYDNDLERGDAQLSKTSKSKPLIQGKLSRAALQAANELAKAVLLSLGEAQGSDNEKEAANSKESEWGDLNRLDLFNYVGKMSKKDKGKLTSADPVEITSKAMKALTELSADDKGCQQRIIEMGALQLLRRFMLTDDYESPLGTARLLGLDEEKDFHANEGNSLVLKKLHAAHLRKHAARMLSMLSLQPSALAVIEKDEAWLMRLEQGAKKEVSNSNDLKICSYARASLLNLRACKDCSGQNHPSRQMNGNEVERQSPRYEDKVFIINTGSPLWEHLDEKRKDNEVRTTACNNSSIQEESTCSDFQMDVVFVHGLRGGPFKTWRIADDKTSSTSKAGLVEKIDVDSGREGTCWPKEWLARDIPTCRMLTVKYKTNLSQWSGTTLPLQEVSAMLLEKLLAAGVGDRPVVFITHSMGGLVVKQMLMQAEQGKELSQIVKNTAGIVFYSCPHFGSKLADMPWRLGLVLRPAPSIRELRSGSARLEELNQFIRIRHKAGLHILSFSETKVTPLVEGYGGWALRMEVVPIESAYPGFGELVVLDGTDHVNSCKPLSHDDIAYTQTLEFLQKISKVN